LRFEAGAGQEHDMKQAVPRVKACLPAGHVLADKAYDADSLIKRVRETGAKVCIPPKSNRLDPHDHDKALCKERNQVERMFGKLKRVQTCRDPIRQTCS